MNILDIRNLNIAIKTEEGAINILNNFDLSIKKNQIHALIGESGSGKSMVAKIILGIQNPSWEVTADRMNWNGIDLLKMSVKKRRKLMNNDMSMIYQEPSSYLDPSMTIGQQLEKVYRVKKKNWFSFGRKKSRDEDIKRVMQKVGIKNQKRIMESYAWELPEGICQKIMIALAIINKPLLLIADEPTNMMSASTCEQIYRLMYKLNQNNNLSILIVTNDIKSIESWADFVSILYCGQKIEYGKTEKITSSPKHPYSHSLINSKIYIEDNKTIKDSAILKGNIPSLNHIPIGCRLGPRCPYSKKECMIFPKFVDLKDHSYACYFPKNINSEKDE